jgi:hypothetical protein
VCSVKYLPPETVTFTVSFSYWLLVVYYIVYSQLGTDSCRRKFERLKYSSFVVENIADVFYVTELKVSSDIATENRPRYRLT